MATDATTSAEFENVFDELFPKALNVAYRVLGHVKTAEDVAAEALARTFLDWRRIKGLPYREAWVLRVATNLAVDVLRRRPPEIVAAAAVASPEEIVDMRLALGAALRSLPRRQRQAIALRYLADLPYAEVATLLHISQGSVKLHVHRGLKALRGRLGPNLSEVIAHVDA